MKIFNEIGKKTTETTGRIARETKIKLKTNENKNRISEIYEDIGKKVYEKHIREEGINIKEDLKAECTIIDGLSKEIEDLRKELLMLSKKKQCPKCDNEMEIDYNFCPRCGEKQNDEPSVFEEALEELETAKINPEDKEKAEIVKEELTEKILDDD